MAEAKKTKKKSTAKKTAAKKPAAKKRTAAQLRAEAEKKKQGLSSADGRKAPPIPRPAGG